MTDLIAWLRCSPRTCFLLALACQRQVPTHPDAGDYTCEQACERAAELNCTALLTPDNATCEEACATAEANGSNFCTREIIAAETCAAIDTVAMRGCE